MRDKQPVGALPVYCLRTASPTAEAWPSREGLEETNEQTKNLYLLFIRWSENKRKNCSLKPLQHSHNVQQEQKQAGFFLFLIILTKSHETTEKPGAGTKLFILGDLNELIIITITISPSLHTVRNL